MPKRVKVGYVKKDYVVNKGINIPQNITHHLIDGKHLFIAPEKASWISTNEMGKIFLDYFGNGYSIKQVIDELRLKNIENEVITSELRDFLVKVEKKGFLEDAVIREEESEISLQLYLTTACNLKCSHCYLGAGKVIEDELSVEEFGAIIDEFACLHKTKVVFTGGEPLLFGDNFFKLADRAKKNNLRVQLFTNGTLISRKIKNKLEEYVDEIQFSLDGATTEVNDEIRGQGVFNRVLENLRLLMNTKIKLKLSMVLMPGNAADLKRNIETLAQSLDNVEMKFGFAIIEGRADESLKFSSPAEGDRELQEILKILYKKKLKAMIKFEPNLIVRNCGYGEVITVSSNGDVFPCAVLKYKTGNIRTDNFSGLVEDIKKRTIASNVENLEGCSQCDLEYICFGGCRLNNITYNNSILKPHCPPEKKEELYKKLVVRDSFDALSIWLGDYKN